MRNVAHDIVGQLGLSGTGRADDQTGMAHVQISVNELLGGHGLSCGNRERIHLMVLLSVEIDDLNFLSPFSELDLVAGLVHVVIEDRALLGELDR